MVPNQNKYELLINKNYLQKSTLTKYSFTYQAKEINIFVPNNFKNFNTLIRAYKFFQNIGTKEEMKKEGCEMKLYHTYQCNICNKLIVSIFCWLPSIKSTYSSIWHFKRQYWFRFVLSDPIRFFSSLDRLFLPTIGFDIHFIIGSSVFYCFERRNVSSRLRRFYSARGTVISDRRQWALHKINTETAFIGESYVNNDRCFPMKGRHAGWMPSALTEFHPVPARRPF